MRTITTAYAGDTGYMVLCLSGYQHVTIICEYNVIKLYSSVCKDGLVFNNLFNAVTFASDALANGQGFTE